MARRWPGRLVLHAGRPRRFAAIHPRVAERHAALLDRSWQQSAGAGWRGARRRDCNARRAG